MLVSLSPENVSKWSKDFLFLFLKSVLVRWMKLEPIIQSEVRQKEKHQYSMLLLLLSHFSRVWLCDPTDGSSPGTAIPGILQARTLEWIAISFSNAWKWKVKVKSLSPTLSDPMDGSPTRLLHPWDFPGKSTGVGCLCLLHQYSILMHIYGI